MDLTCVRLWVWLSVPWKEKQKKEMPLIQKAVSRVAVTSSSWDGEFQSWSFSAYFILKVPLDLNLDPSVATHISQDHKIGGWGLFNNQRERRGQSLPRKIYALANTFFFKKCGWVMVQANLWNPLGGNWLSGEYTSWCTCQLITALLFLTMD